MKTIEHYTKPTDYSPINKLMVIEQMDLYDKILFVAWRKEFWENERKHDENPFRTAYFIVKPRLTPAI